MSVADVTFAAADPAGADAQAALRRYLAEIKRMWIDPTTRGRGLGGRLLDTLEDAARDLGYDRLRLDTREVLVEAIGLYEAHDYRLIEPYHDGPDPTHFSEKRLVGADDPPSA